MRQPLDSAIFLAAFTGVLYCLSTAHYHGFLTTAKLDADMMERSFHQVIYSGLIVSFGPILIFLITVSCVLFSYSHALLPGYIDWVRGSIKAKRKVVSFRRRWIGKRISALVEIRAKKTFNHFLVLSLAGVCFIVSLVYVEKKGQSQALTALGNHVEGETRSSSNISVVISSNIKVLSYLGCGAKNCAGIEKGSNRVYYFPQSTGFSFVHDVEGVTKP
ncbi:hypothetical protein IOQ59_17185 [Pontibacterium sp. N1Y112]|uniref:Uncharacterized protein n=1 Tax=Pontibacterium sinense TaxID=2781979 RepID=A0A8J7FS22_9GAMM|nr:hypothetical protein [Pontibacterium sinense]MBE9398997.1 hypothetical protein [Pontibacterium sinense]